MSKKSLIGIHKGFRDNDQDRDRLLSELVQKINFLLSQESGEGVDIKDLESFVDQFVLNDDKDIVTRDDGVIILIDKPTLPFVFLGVAVPEPMMLMGG